ncbi:hypothetical protein EST38_g1003 [Candolleomyces aberdarensis]|uniref:Uncharacterized protein n=1 Tax=Candolleomyces aberdarensis TaxID=2316362 RepID=A0A4Q2DYI9_9AGAR|nr:hypothetical protein EST38_g1003 [Candolleomyces aberdarensis]
MRPPISILQVLPGYGFLTLNSHYTVRHQPNPATQAIVSEQWIKLILLYARHKKLFYLRVDDAESPGGDWDEILRNGRINRRLPPTHLSSLLETMVSKNVATYEPLKQTRSVLLYWRLPEEWAEVLYQWASSTGQINTILTFYEITDPPVESPLTNIPIPLLRKAITILTKSNHAKVAFTNRVVEGFGKMDEKSPLESVRKAAEKVEKGVKLAKGDNGLLAQLLEALEDFNSRMVPFFETTQARAEEIEAVRKEREVERQRRLEAERNQLEDLQALRRELRLVQQRSSNLEAEAIRMRKEATNAATLLDEATIAGEQLKNQMVDTGKDRDNFKRLYTESEEDKRRLSDLVERNANYVRDLFILLDPNVDCSTSLRQAKRTREEFKKTDKELKRLKAVEAAHEHLKEKHRQALADLQNLPLSLAQSTEPQDYDENCSSHEETLSMRTRIHEKKSIEFDFEGLPKPGFGTDWQLKGNRSYGPISNARPPGAAQSQRRVANPVNFPLKLDRKGKPMSAVQLGPKRSVRI